MFSLSCVCVCCITSESPNIMLCYCLYPIKRASKIKSIVSHCDSRPSNKVVCNREQGTHTPLKETQCDTQVEYVYANINENTSSSSFYVLLSNYAYYY